MAEPLLSVVVIGRNEGSRLLHCLDSLRAMSFPGPLEVIYVDSASSDGSAARAAGWGARVIEIEGGRLSAARARNAGWQASSTPFILFLDGDTVLDRDFVARAFPEFRDDRLMVVWGHRHETHAHASIYNRVCDLDWYTPPGFTEFCGGDSIMRRTALERTGGFNADLIAGEEPDLCRRIRAGGGLVLHIDAPMTGHDLGILSWKQYWGHAFRAGHAYAEIAERYKKTDDPLWIGASRGNAAKALLYLVAPFAGILGAILTRSWIFIWLPLLCLSVIIARTAFKSRKRPGSLVTILLFAVHSHVQQIPIFMGQVRYWRNTKRHVRSELIEYKKSV